jgi:hypothetical protein
MEESQGKESPRLGVQLYIWRAESDLLDALLSHGGGQQGYDNFVN